MTKREQELLEQGWKERTVIDDFRVADLVDTYESLGFACLVEPVPLKEESDECGNCRVCFEDERFRDRYKVLYTRKK